MFSLESLYLVYAFFLLFAGIMILIVVKKTGDFPTKFFAYSCFTYSIGLGVIISRNYLPTWIGFGVGNFLPIFSLYLIRTGIQSISDKYKVKVKNLLLVTLICFGYASLFPILLSLNNTTYFPLIAGLGLGLANLLVVWKIPEECKNNLYIKIIIFASCLLGMIWLLRGIVGLRVGFVYALDPTLLNWVLTSLLLFLNFVRLVSLIVMRLDKSFEYQKTLKRLNNSLLQTVKEKNEFHDYSQNLEDGMLDALKKLAKERDNETGNHIIRTQNYVRLIAERLYDLGKLEGNHAKDWIDVLYKAAPLHDIGKVGIPDAILLKPGKLDSQEWEIMKTHANIGERVLQSASRDGILNSDILKVAIEISGSHHEHWDGNGYPSGMSGKNIPQSGRIMAVADVYDALTTSRPYKKPWSHSEAVDYINSLRNSKFDPEVVDAFLFLSSEFEIINKQYAD